MNAALQAIDLRRLYEACNRKWFAGKLPAVSEFHMADKYQWKALGGHKEVAFFSPADNSIVMKVDWFVENPNRLLDVFVHEMAHVQVVCVDRMAFDIKLKKNGERCKNPYTHHGEAFGSLMRKLQRAGAPVDRLDMYHGREGKALKHRDDVIAGAWGKWRYDCVWDEQHAEDDYYEAWEFEYVSFEESSQRHLAFMALSHDTPIDWETHYDL